MPNYGLNKRWHFTGSSISTFMVEHESSGLPLLPYKVGENYEFTLYVESQFNGIIQKRVMTHIASAEIQQVTIDSLAAAMRSNSQRYVGYPIRFTAKIEALKGLSVNLDTNQLKGEDKFLIYFYPDENTYIEGQSYTFLLFVINMNEHSSHFTNVIQLYPLKP